jgi:O-antigen ligase
MAIGFLFAAYIALLPVQIGGTDFRVAPSDLMLIAYLVLHVGVPRVERSAWSIWQAGLVSVFLIGALIAAVDKGFLSQFVLLNKLIGLAVLFAAYAMITAEATDWPKIRSAIRVFVLSVAFQNLVALVAYYKIVPLVWPLNDMSNQGRLTGLLVDPNAYGGLLVTALVIHAATFFGGSPLMGRLLGVITTISLMGGVLLTFSRSAWLGVVFGFLFLALFRTKVAVYLVGSLASAAVVLFLTNGSSFVNFFVNMATRERQVSARVEILDLAFDLFGKRPIFGIGLGQFQNYHTNIIHNTPVWFLTEFGLVGFAVFLGLMTWFLWKGLYTFWREPSGMKWIALGLVTAHICLTGLSLGIEAFYQRHWWLVFGLISACHARLLRDRFRWTVAAPEGLSARGADPVVAHTVIRTAKTLNTRV